MRWRLPVLTIRLPYAQDPASQPGALRDAGAERIFTDAANVAARVRAARVWRVLRRDMALGVVAVLGWSMGGMIAQALAVLHPGQVRRLVLCATYPGTGSFAVPTQAAIQRGSDFPANQVNAYDAFKAAIAEYPAAPRRRSLRKRLRVAP